MHSQVSTRKRKHLGRITGATVLFLLLVGVTLPASSLAAKRSDRPVTVILAHPGRVSHSSQATFVFYSNYWDVDSYRCSIDLNAFKSCVPLRTYYRLKPGKHHFAVKAVSNQSEGPTVRFDWVVKAKPKRVVAPTVSINSHPSLNTASTSATFSFSSNRAKPAFLCAIDQGASAADSSYSRCKSPLTYTDLAPGYHTFAVIAAGSVLKSRPQTFTWSISAVAPVNTTAPVVTGTAQVGQTVTTTGGSWTGSLPISLKYQWQLCSGAPMIVSAGSIGTDTGTVSCGDIVGATSPSYTVKSEGYFLPVSTGQSSYTAQTVRGIGPYYTLRVVVTATNAGGQAEAVSAETSTVLFAPPVNTAIPAISGDSPPVADVSSLTTTDGSWSAETYWWIVFTYQWQRCDTSGNNCVNISTGAASATYAVTAGDVGSTLRVVVTATTTDGGVTSAASLPTAVVLD